MTGDRYQSDGSSAILINSRAWPLILRRCTAGNKRTAHCLRRLDVTEPVNPAS
jgi:hypothetical protein